MANSTTYMDGLPRVTTPNATLPPEATVHPDEWYFIRSLSFYMMGVVIPLGLICNALALAVFIRSPALRRTVTGHFLMALSIADAIFLMGDFIRWLNPSMKDFYMGMNHMHTSDFLCKFTHFLRYFGRFSSAWITVAITAQRFLTVVKALEVAHISTVFRVRVLLTLIGVISFLVSLFPFWTIGKTVWEQRQLCTYLGKSGYATWNVIIMRFGSLLVPAVIIFVLTGIIVYDLLKAKRTRKSSLNVQTDNSSSSIPLEHHLSTMLIAVALAFLCLQLPYTVAYHLNEFKEEVFTYDARLFYEFYCAYKITDVIATLNNASNFFLYCLVGSTFRRHLVLMFTCKPPRRLSTVRGRNVTQTSSLKTSHIEQNSIKFHPNKNSQNNLEMAPMCHNGHDQFA